MFWSSLPILSIFAILSYSGLAKLGVQKTVREAAEGLGLSPKLSVFVARWLAVGELSVAALLLFSSTAIAGAVAAFALFAAFTALIASNLRQGRRPACACFGEASAAAISEWTLARNVVFAALALLATLSAANDGGGAIRSLAEMGGGLAPATAFAIVVLMQFFLLVIYLTQARPQAAAPAAPLLSSGPDPDLGWPPGSRAPAFDMPSLEGPRVSLSALLNEGRRVALLFVSPGCRHCLAMLPEIERWQAEPGGSLSVVVISTGSAQANRDKIGDFQITRLLLQGGDEVAEAYRAHATPAAVVVGQSGRIESRLALGSDAVRRLVEAWITRSRENAPASILSPPPPPDPRRLTSGDPVPPFSLPAVRGGTVSLEEFAGRVVVLMFWSPTCGHCARFAPELRVRESENTVDSAPLLFISSGSLEANEALGFESPLALDDGSVMRACGAGGTPSALLVDAEGRVGSALATGAEDIRALLRRADLMTQVARRTRV